MKAATNEKVFSQACWDRFQMANALKHLLPNDLGGLGGKYKGDKRANATCTERIEACVAAISATNIYQQFPSRIQSKVTAMLSP